MIIAIGTSSIQLLVATAGADAFGFARGSGAGETEPISDAAAIGIVALTCLGAAVLAWMVAAAMRRDRAGHGPAVRLLAGQLGLSAARRVLMCRVARRCGLPSAGSLLISRGCFDAAVKRYVPRRGEAARLREIRKTLFG